MDKIIVEARVNELAQRDLNPNVPLSPAEIAADAAACSDAGAAIVHWHGRAPDGAPDNSPEHYLETIRRVRAACPALLHPSLGYVANKTTAEGRFAAIEAAMSDLETRVDFAPMDTGSVNVDWWDPEASTYATTDLVYENSTATLLHFARRIRHHRLKPYCVSWNVSFIRQLEALMAMGEVERPAYLCFCLTDGTMLSGHPGTEAGLDAHLAFLPEGCVWTVVNYKGDILALTERIIAAGGHVSLGTGDYHHPDLGHPTNAELVERVVAQARAHGREPASVEETRAILGMEAPAAA